MSARERRKGAVRERQLVRMLRDEGIEAERVGVAYASGHDIDLYPFGRDAGALVAEVKARKSGEGFKTLETWLGENDLLFLIKDRSDPMVCLSWSTWEMLLRRLKQ